LHFISILLLFNHTATTNLFPLSLHDALPILLHVHRSKFLRWTYSYPGKNFTMRSEVRSIKNIRPGYDIHMSITIEIGGIRPPRRSEEHTSELQSRENLVCRLLLEKKK